MKSCVVLPSLSPSFPSSLPASREVWPDDAFGGSGMSVEEELDTIKAILFNPAAGEKLDFDWSSCSRDHMTYMVLKRSKHHV